MLDILPLRALDDNYIWLIHNGHHAAVVDPGEAEPVLDFLADHRLALAAILITHHHADHTGGVAALLDRYPATPVHGSGGGSIAAVNHPAREGTPLEIPALNLLFDVLEVPGHTLDHVAYYGANHLFCGDTLFGCGCGRLFEGTPAQMLASLRKITALPDETQICCAHEYTLNNIRFAKGILPGNARLTEREIADRERVAQGQPTVPFTLALEKATSPFLRWDDPEIIAAATRFRGRETLAPAEVFSAIRAMRDSF